MTEEQRRQIIRFQKEEITGHHFYNQLAGRIKNPHNAAVVRNMAATEMGHYQFWQKLSRAEVGPDRLRIFFLMMMARLLGLTFTVKLAEKVETVSAAQYVAFEPIVPGAAQLGRDEEEHEAALAGMIEEEFLQYVGSIVLGLNDALVELTGALAGLTFALQNVKLVAISGLITGIAAAFSMAASEFLSARADGNARAGRSALYTGVAYLITVVLLILPYALVPPTGRGIFISLAITLAIAIVIIFMFNFYVSVAKDLPFKARFLEMLGISMGVAAFSFVVGLVVRNVFGVDI